MTIGEVYNKYSDLYKIKRSGWIKRGINDPESIADHELNSMLMAFMFLSEKEDSPAPDGYDKSLVIELLLIHDLGENDIGDIIRGEKTKDDKERELSSIIDLLTGISDHNGDKNRAATLKRLWLDMESPAPVDVNARIAKEIDYIQGAYQFFKYCVDGAYVPAAKSCAEWLEEVSDKYIKTSVGKTMRDELILKNELFTRDKTLGGIIRSFF